jgi:hypothetical protein
MAPWRWRPRKRVRLGARRTALLIEAALWLLLARLALAIVPFPLLARRLGTFVPPAETTAGQDQIEAQREHAQVAHEIGWAVSAATRYAPYRPVCLPQAMAARMMLKRRGVPSIIHFGAAKQQGAFAAHAWLDAAGVEVVGFPVRETWTEIARFV